uniref:Glutamate rich 5 n=1 Tax=Nannospalax galili TaxID=1026970 RepID=A0A8C6R1S0_NANGA
MGCSSSALHRADDSSRFRSGEQSESCVVQPKPCTPGRESTFHGNTQKETLLLEGPKASVVPTANGVKSHHQPSPVKNVATDQSGPTKKAEPLEQQEERDSPQSGGKAAKPETEGTKRDAETGTEAQPLKGNAETEPLRTAWGRDSPGNSQAGEVMQRLGTVENVLPLETAGELPPGEATGKDKQPQSLEAIPKENNSPETLEGCQFGEKVDQQELQETPGKDEQSQLLETVLKENATPEISDRSQLVQTPVTNDPLRETPEGSRNVAESQPEETVGCRKHPAGIAEAAANMGMSRKARTVKEEQHIEGETGEKVGAEVKNKAACEGDETKEEETGDALDLSAAGDSDR